MGLNEPSDPCLPFTLELINLDPACVSGMAVYLGASSSFDFAPWKFCAEESTDFIEGIQSFLIVLFAIKCVIGFLIITKHCCCCRHSAAG